MIPKPVMELVETIPAGQMIGVCWCPMTKQRGNDFRGDCCSKRLLSNSRTHSNQSYQTRPWLERMKQQDRLTYWD